MFVTVPKMCIYKI